jgi:hypothetical protein
MNDNSVGSFVTASVDTNCSSSTLSRL